MLKFVLIFILGLHISSYAQTFKFEVGPEQNMREVREALELNSVRKAVGKSLFGKYQVSVHAVYDTINKKAHVILGESGDRFYGVSTFDNYLLFADRKNLIAEEASTSEQKLSIAEIVNRKGKRFLFYVVHDEKRDERTVYVNELDNNMVILGSPIKITSATNVKSNETSYFVKSSNGGKYTGILSISEGKGVENERSVMVIDENFSVVWTKKIDGNKFAKDYAAESWLIDDFGNIYELGYANQGKKKTPVLYSYFKDGNKIMSEAIQHEDNEIFDCAMKMPVGIQSPVVVGLFEKNKQLGYVAFKPVPASSSIQKVSTGTMAEDFMGPSRKWQFYNDRYQVINAVCTANGDFVFSLESTYMVTKAAGFPIYQSGPVVLVSLNNKGQENWKRILFKNQGGSGAMFSNGHMLITAGNDVLAIYNDNPNNLSKGPNDQKIDTYNGIKTSLVMQKFDSHGVVKKEALNLPSEADQYVLLATNHYKIQRDLYQVQLMRLKGMKALQRICTMKVN